MSESIIGQEKLIERLVLVLLANGNLLLEGLPGLAKTRAIKSLASELNCGLSRIQFTPDLLPSDVTGTEIYQPEGEVHIPEGPHFQQPDSCGRNKPLAGQSSVCPPGGHGGTPGFSGWKNL